MHSIKFCVHLPLPPIFSLWQVVLEFVDTYQPWKQRHIHYGSNQGCVPFCFIVLGTTKNSLFYQDSSGLLMKFMPIALHGIPHISYLLNLLNLIEQGIENWTRKFRPAKAARNGQSFQRVMIFYLPYPLIVYCLCPFYACLLLNYKNTHPVSRAKSTSYEMAIKLLVGPRPYNFIHLLISKHCLYIAKISSHKQQHCFTVCFCGKESVSKF